MALDILTADFGSEGAFERPGCALRYWLRESERADAPLMLLLHGAGVDHRMWAPQMDAFAARYRVLSLDQRGHGASQPARGYSFAALADDALALLDHVGGDPGSVVVGLSMGGNVAQEMIRRAPHRFAAAVLADCTCNSLVPAADRLLIPLYRATLRPLFAVYLKSAFARQIGEASALTPAAQAYVSGEMARYSKAELAMMMQTLLVAVRHRPDYVTPIPTLLVRGEADRLGNIAKVMPLWAARDPKCEPATIPAAGHMANLDNPAAFNRAALDWLVDLGV